MENQVYVLRKIHPDSWTGIRLYTYANEDIGPAIDDQGLPITGLTENSTKPNSKGNTEIVRGTRELLEEKMGLEPGTLKKGSLIKPSPFWLNFCVRIGEGDEKFDTSVPENQLKVEFLKAQPQVAFGVKNIKAKSEYVLFTREEEAKQSNEGKTIKREAYKIFETLTLQDKVEVLEMHGVRTASMTADVVEDKLTDLLEEYPIKFKALATDPTRKNKTFIRQLLDKGILSIDGGAVMYNEVILGYDIDSAAVKLFSEEEAKTREALKIQLNDK
jgi:hypothetical protein